ncbi:hypothetical protein RFN69_00985 [Lactiplantibacillus plantarum]|uniref:hypothetical protein n=1 Tax=Lactiplantibacillus plantarum TaxID=1590 RepID=UPI002866A3B5|nr:hypothetical protein [Lactiplantibacillus plantarum]MDR7675870.1 hypothetical protein [Lactiplantibacillus plantarum]
MGKPIYELSKLNDISKACKQAAITIERVNVANASISAISELVAPTLKKAITGDDNVNYFELNDDELRDFIDEQGNTIYNTMCVLTEMDELSALIDSKTAALSGVIDDINSTVNGINDGINSILDGGNSDYSDDNSQGATNHE